MGDFAAAGAWPGVLERLAQRGELSPEVAAGAMAHILGGEATPAQTAGFLLALRTKGETPTEVASFVDAMLAAAAPLPLDDPDSTLDLVGTGGSKTLSGGAFNVSTMASFVAAAAGAVVCKHGNRKASSTSGSTDLLDVLGVEVELDGDGVAACVRDAGIGFAFARTFHPAMRHAAPVRAELGIRTVFNLLGPLSHPGRVGHQVIGVADPERIDLVAAAVAARGTNRSWVVHGHDGLDEVTTTAATSVVEVIGHDQARRFELHPDEAGIPIATVADITIGDPSQNAAAANEMLEGAEGPIRDMVVLNAAVGLVVCGVVEELPAGVDAATAAIDTGAAAATLGKLVAASRAIEGAE
ncbi:MAG: anthranilate phosphoribosyltransferase [Microthrixaceae bacterium]